jgi:methyl-accepting chemotaxis protein
MSLALLRKRSFHDLPLWVKVLITPAAGLVAGLAVAVAVWLGASETETRLATAVEQSLPRVAASTRLLDVADQIQVTAMRAMVLQQAGMPQATIAALTKDIQAGLARLQDGTAALVESRGQGDRDLPRLQSVAAAANDYAGQLRKSLELIGDPSIAVGFFRRADTAFAAFRAGLADLSAADRAAEEAAIQAARASSHEALIRLCWILGGASVVMLILLPAMATAITRPVRALTRTMSALAAGNLAVDATGQAQRDELGDMARAVDVFRRNAIEARGLSEEREAAQMAKERRQAALAVRTAAFGQSVSGILASLSESAAGMRRVADELATAAAGVRAQAGDTASDAQGAARDLASVAAAAEELAASSAEISRQVTSVSAIARETVERAGASYGKITGLAAGAARIGDVVGLIGEIASRTSLLALNATIEAARAGEAGKGFAVVAGEVKALAAQTAKATAEIAEQIATIRASSTEAVRAMDEVSQSIGRMDAVTESVAAAVEQQGAATRQIAASVQAASGATEQTTQAMGVLAGVADSTATLSGAVLHAATGVGQQAETLHAEIDRFLVATRDDAEVPALAA